MRLRWWAFSTILIALAGGSGLFFVLTQIHPDSTPAAQLLLFALLFITFGAITVPISALLHHRFAAKSWRKKDPNRLLRHAGEVGILVVALAYLQRLQTLDWMVAIVLLGVFALMETFYLTRN